MLAEALGRERATSEILRVISRSSHDLARAGAAILENATRLCEAQLGNLFVYEGGAFHAVAHHNASPQFIEVLAGSLRPDPETGIDAFIANPRPWQLADLLVTQAYAESEAYTVVAADLEGIRTLLGVPLIEDGGLAGVRGPALRLGRRRGVRVRRGERGVGCMALRASESCLISFDGTAAGDAFVDMVWSPVRSVPLVAISDENGAVLQPGIVEALAADLAGLEIVARLDPAAS